MESDLFRFDDPRDYRRKKTNHFAWTILILFLIGLAFAAWLGSLYVLGQPERPESYRILQKLHKIEPPRRFALTAAPAGEFLDAKKIYARYSVMGPNELARTDAELTRNFIRNFQQVRGLVTYVVGRYSIMSARELTPNDVFSPGAVVLARANDQPELLLEHVFTTANPHDAELLTPHLALGTDLYFERSHDLSAVVHVERLGDGRIQVTAIPLLYGSYAVARGTGTFSLAPPAGLNLAAGWPLVKDSARHRAEVAYDAYRAKLRPPSTGVPIAGVRPAATPPETHNALVRVEVAEAVEEDQEFSGEQVAHGRESAMMYNPERTPASTSKPGPSATPLFAVQSRHGVAALSPGEAPKALPIEPRQSSVPVAVSATATPTVLRALPVDAATPTVAIASTTGATWKTFPPGQMPVGRLLDTGKLRDIAKTGTRGERMYLRGQFVVNFADGNRAVLRPTTGGGISFNWSSRGNASRNARIIVDYPPGVPLPQPGSTLDRDASRPFEITEVREQSDGQLNVFVREIIKSPATASTR